MAVNLRRFVDINIYKAESTRVNPVRDTAALFVAKGTTITGPEEETNLDWVLVDATIDSAGDIVLKSEGGNAVEFSDGNVKYYAKYFFDNGGVKLHVVEMGGDSLTASDIQKLPESEIAVMSVSGLTDAELADACKAYNEAYVYDGSTDTNAKLFIGSRTGTSAVTGIDNLAIKVGPIGCEATIAAYLTKINPYKTSTVHDYCYTIEKLFDRSNGNAAVTADESYDEDTDLANLGVSTVDATVAACMDNNLNVDTVIASQVRNVGGDTVAGDEIVDFYCCIMMQQTLQERLVGVLSTKLQGAEANAAIYAAMAQELSRYAQAGYIVPGNWGDTDWTITHNGREYTVVQANSRLSTGYSVLVVPYAALTTDEVTAHKAPPVYVAYISQYGIRKITVEGRVL